MHPGRNIDACYPLGLSCPHLESDHFWPLLKRSRLPEVDSPTLFFAKMKSPIRESCISEGRCLWGRVVNVQYLCFRYLTDYYNSTCYTSWRRVGFVIFINSPLKGNDNWHCRPQWSIYAPYLNRALPRNFTMSAGTAELPIGPRQLGHILLCLPIFHRYYVTSSRPSLWDVIQA